MPKKIIAFRLDPADIAFVADVAKKQNRSLGYVIGQIIQEKRKLATEGVKS